MELSFKIIRPCVYIYKTEYIYIYILILEYSIQSHTLHFPYTLHFPATGHRAPGRFGQARVRAPCGFYPPFHLGAGAQRPALLPQQGNISYIYIGTFIHSRGRRYVYRHIYSIHLQIGFEMLPSSFPSRSRGSTPSSTIGTRCHWYVNLLPSIPFYRYTYIYVCPLSINSTAPLPSSFPSRSRDSTPSYTIGTRCHWYVNILPSIPFYRDRYIYTCVLYP